VATTTRKPGAERRAEIAKAVLRIVGEHGLTELTTAAVAGEIGVSSGALFRHVASRDEMLEEAVRHGEERIEATFPDPSLPPLDRLLGLARNRVRLFTEEPGLAWLLLSEQAFLTMPARAVHRLRGLAERSGRYLLDAIREGVEKGAVRDDVEPEALVVIVKGAIHALAPMRGVHRGAARAADRVLDALRLLLSPIGTNPKRR
jgi:AcrR family transcriptional regulator